MKVGTKSLLFGYHAFWLHPFFVAEAWRRLYGWTWDVRHWAGFFLHDVGYFGKPNMDGIEGKEHPFLGAYIMHKLFDGDGSARWFQFSLYHSRDMANLYFGKLSRLCHADKLAFCLYPKWLLKLVYWLSGEAQEYIDNGRVLLDTNTADFDEWYFKAVEYNLETLKEAHDAERE